MAENMSDRHTGNGPRLPNYMQYSTRMSAAFKAGVENAVKNMERESGLGEQEPPALQEEAPAEAAVHPMASGSRRTMIKRPSAQHAAARTVTRRNTSTSSSGSRSGSGKKGQKKSSGAKGSGGGGGGKKKKEKTRSQRILKIAIGVLACLLVIVAVILIVGHKPAGQTMNVDYADISATFADGVRIEGIDVSGLTMIQARNEVLSSINRKLGDLSYTLQIDDKDWAIAADEMGIKTNIDEVIEEAINAGRGETSGDDEEPAVMAFNVALSADRTKVVAALNRIAEETNTRPVNAHAVPSLSENHHAHFQYVDGKDGRELDVETLSNAVIDNVKKEAYQAQIEPVFNYTAPSVKVDFIKENTKFISEFTTTFSNSSDQTTQNRVANIRKATEMINCLVVNPNIEWSFNDFVGPRTLKGGWLEANGISGGDSYTLQAGGGICQVSTTLYNALLRGNVKITDRKKHSIPSTYVTEGLDATVDTSGIDLKFLNDTGAPLYVFVYVTKNEKSNRKLDITVTLYGKPLDEGVKYVARTELLEREPLAAEPEYIKDSTIPKDYQVLQTQARDRIVVEVYLDKYVDGKVVDSKYLYKDTYRGNVAKYRVGTGSSSLPVPEGAEYIGKGPEPPSIPIDADGDGEAD